MKPARFFALFNGKDGMAYVWDTAAHAIVMSHLENGEAIALQNKLRKEFDTLD